MNKCRLTMMFIALLLAVTSAKALTQDVAGNYLIGSVQDWIDFAEIIDKTNTGANARMTSDVDLGDDQTHIGYNENKRYCGIFDGGGHRLIVKYNSSAYGLAPFRYTAGATIKNMHIDGSIISTYSPESHTSGVISHSKGEDVISNVWVSVDIQSGGSGWIECAAFIGCNNSGSSTITDCLFTGSMKTTSGTYNGCFVGYCDTNGYATVNNCLSIGTFDYYGNNYVENVRMNFSNCYVKQFPSSIPEAMQVTDDQLANGTTVTNLNNGRTGDDAPWVQEGGQPMLKLFALQQDTDNYYLLSSASHWKQFANIVKTTPTANAKMIADIELEEGDNTRIGDTRQDIESGIFYQGVFDGQGHTLTVHYNVTDGVPAPFTHINGATIKNLHVAGTINTSLHHSSVVAHVRGGTNLVSNIWSSLDVITSKNSWDECSAIVSWMGNATLTIEDCLFTGSITCTNGSSYNGCFIGWHQYDAVAQIKNCLSTGTFNSTTDWDATRGCPHTNCYIKQFPASIPTEMQVTDENLSNGTTTTALNGERTGDDAPWVQEGNQPMLKLFAMSQDGDGNFLIGSVQDWKEFAELVKTTPTANAKMTADIDLGDDQTVIGGVYNGSTLFYQGTFDGQGHTLTVAYNVKSGDGERFTTPFSLIEGATIKNLHLDGTVNTTYAYGGSIASILKGGANTIENVWNSVNAVCTDVGWAQMGAFIGVLENGTATTATISDCLYTGSITHNGGYSGYFNGGYGPKPTVNNCLVLGTFTGEFGFNGNYNNCYCKHASTTGVTKPSDDNLANGTTTAALNGERTGDDAPWVQYGDTPMLKFFYSKNLVAHEGDVTGEYWTTFFCSDKNYKINDAEEATAYTATLNGSTITLHTLNKDIPKNTAVIIKGEDDEISMNIVSDPDLVVPDNDLHGVDVQTNTDDIKTALGDGTLYVLGYTNSHFGFHKYTGTTMPAHKAFLLIDGSGALLSNTLDIDFGDGTTGMESIKNGKWIINNYYDLSGRRVENPTKGLYIVNGKKVIIK